MSSLIPIAIVALLIILNGLFVAAEFALIGAPRASVEHKAKLGDRLAMRLQKILSDRLKQDRYIATAQLGITLASLGLGMYGEHMLAAWLEVHLRFLPLPSWLTAHAIASLVAIVFLTYLHIVIGEMVPKSLALQKPERTAIWVALPMQWTQTLLFPLVIALNGIGNAVLRGLGMRRSDQGEDLYHTSDELEFVIKESQEGGLLRKETSEVLQELLEFGDLKAREVMVPRVKIVGIPLGTKNGDLLKILDRATHTRYLVYGESLDHIVGSIHIKDFLRNKLSGRPIEKSDARPVPYVPEAASLEQVLQTMRTHSAQMVVVMDEYGGTAGLITIEDLFEEIVGDIDETEQEIRDHHIGNDGYLHVNALLRLDEVSERFGMNLEHDEVDTVGGLVLTLLGKSPTLNDTVEFKGVLFTVTEVDGHGVGRCKLFKLS